MARLTELLKIPNQLTLLRLGFLPFFLIAIHERRYDWALGILVAAAFTDGLDGLLARRLNQKTALGAYLDPIADKLLLSSSFFVLSLNGLVRWWLTILVLGRDVLILVVCAAILATSNQRSFPPSWIGKVTTAGEIIFVFIVLLDVLMDHPALTFVHRYSAYLVAFLVIASGLHYSIIIARRLSSE